MIETREHFEKRLQFLGEKHATTPRGFGTKVGRDGLITVTPVAGQSNRKMGLRIVLLAILGFFAFKAFAVSSAGPVTYNERLAELASGTMIEKLGALVMSIDPVTEMIIRFVTAVLG